MSCTSPPSINLKIDSGTTHHFQTNFSMNLTQQQTFNYNPEARVIMSNRASMVSSTTKNLPITYLPPSATKYHGFNHLEYISLFSVRQTCDHNCTAVLTKICKNI